jgi:predicted transcriptional regulator
VTEIATLLGVSRATVSKLMASYMNHGKTTTVKRNSGQKSTDRKRSSYIVKNCFEKSKNYCSTGDRRAELNTQS